MATSRSQATFGRALAPTKVGRACFGLSLVEEGFGGPGAAASNANLCVTVSKKPTAAHVARQSLRTARSCASSGPAPGA